MTAGRTNQGRRPDGRGSVLVFTGHFHPHVGGVERFTRELWSRLAERGWRVGIVTSDTDGGPRREQLFGLDVTRLPVLKVFHDRLPIVTPSSRLVRMIRDWNVRRPDVIVTNTRFFPTSVLGMMLARRWALPTLHIDHGSEHVSLGHRFLTVAGERYDHLVGGWVVRHATRCVGVSQAVADFLAHLGRPDAGVIYNGVDAATFARGDRGFRTARGIPGDAVQVTYLGRLIADKGITILMKAWAEHASALAAPAHLVIAGDGHMAPEVRSFSENRPGVHFIGPVDGAGVPQVLESADILIHPSHYPEGLPTVILEAGAAGVPVIATSAGGTREIIPDDQHGLIVPARDPAALGKALSDLVAAPERRRALGLALQRRVRTLFDWTAIAETTDLEITALMGTGRAT